MTKRSMLGSLVAVCLVLVLIPALSSEVAGAPAALDAGRPTGTTTTPPFSAAAQTPTSTETPGASPELGCSTLTSPDQIPSPGRIDFDDLPDGTVIQDYYESAHDIVFEVLEYHRAIIYGAEPVTAHSAPNVVRNHAVWPESSSGVPMRISFMAPKTHVGFFVGNGEDLDRMAVLTAYDAQDQVLCQAMAGPVKEPHNVFIGIADSEGRIARLELDYGYINLQESIDDLYYAPAGPGPTATPKSTSSRTATSTATSRPTPTVTPTRTQAPTPTPAPIPATDLVIDGLEVTQAVQALGGGVDLVAHKRTMVRLHCHATVGDYASFAVLKAQRGSDKVYLYPINPRGEIVVRAAPDRGTLNHAFLFELPSAFCQGSVTLTGYLNPPIPGERERDPLEQSYANNTYVQSVTFREVPAVPLVIHSVGYRLGAARYTPSVAERDQMVDWLRRAYPLHALRVWYRTLDAGAALVDDQGELMAPNCGQVNAALIGKKAWDLLFGAPIPTQARYYGLVSDAGGLMRGCATNDLAMAASGPTGADSWGWDDDGSYGDWYGAHELALLYGREVANFCGAEGGPPYPYAQGRISPTLEGAHALYGLDYRSWAILGPAWHDLMTYCDYRWVSDVTYEGLLRYLALPPQSGAEEISTNPMDRLLVTGTIDPLTRAVTLQRPFLIPNAGELNPSEPGPYSLVLRGAEGLELARYPITPRAMLVGPSPTSDVNEGARWLLSVYELVPFVEGALSLELEGPEGPLASISAGPASPSVTLISPNGGEIPVDSPIGVTWAASDADDDSLRFNVQYSSDGGATWELVAQQIEATGVWIDPENLGASSDGVFRVWASDGLHSTYDPSDAPISVPNQPPRLQIMSPEQGHTVAVSQTVALEGWAYDPDSGSLAGSQLTWSSDLDGLLGQGESVRLTGLSVGEHTLTFSAQDDLGAVAQATRRLVVVPLPADLPVADALEASPLVTRLFPQRGATSAIITVLNQNAERSLAWRAEVDRDWLALDATSGVTPAEIRVRYVGDAPGTDTYTGSLLLTSPDLPGQKVRLLVQVVGEHELVLPLIWRQ